MTAAPITITTEHVARLRETGPGGLIAWHETENRVIVPDPGRLLGPEAMVITGYHTLPEVSHALEEGGPSGADEEAAWVLNEVMPGRLDEWPQIRAMTPMVTDLRRALAGIHIFLADSPVYQLSDCQPQIAETYQDANSDLGILVRVITTFAHQLPVRILFHDATSNELLWGGDVSIHTPHHLLAAKLAAHAVETGLVDLRRR